MQHTNQFSTIQEALEDFKLGKPLIVADDEDRENEGDLICSAQFVTPELINFITKECRGLVCLREMSILSDFLPTVAVKVASSVG